MRVVRQFSVRTTDAADEHIPSQKPRRKFYLIYEGSDTERIYFEGLSKYRNTLGLDPLMELIPLKRGFLEKTCSHPKWIVTRVKLNLDAAQTGSVTYGNLLDCVREVLCEWEKASPHPVQEEYWQDLLKQILDGCLKKKPGDLVTAAEIPDVCGKIAAAIKDAQQAGETELRGILSRIPSMIEPPFDTYDPETDRICLIADRDRGNFRTPQYEAVLQTCRDNHIEFYPTNPCFEFWLLLHYDDVVNGGCPGQPASLALDTGKMNLRTAGKYAKEEMKHRMPGYDGTNHQIKALPLRVNDAISRHKALEASGVCTTDPEKLEHQTGSRIGILIADMRPDMRLG